MISCITQPCWYMAKLLKMFIHYSDVVMGAMASQITSEVIVMDRLVCCIEVDFVPITVSNKQQDIALHRFIDTLGRT